MNNERKPSHDQAFESFMQNVRFDARLAGETPRAYATRVLFEIRTTLDLGIQSPEEATSLLAKLAVVGEATNDQALLREASELETDIKERYPDLSMPS